jgi:predicted PurR-regulated permease PerM
MSPNFTPARVLAVTIVVLSGWIVHGFIEALMAACVTAVASWPLYARFRARLSRRGRSGAAAVIFTCVITAFVLAPLVFASTALFGEAHTLLLGIAAADSTGIAVPGWLASMPVGGAWLAAHWKSQLAHPGALQTLTQRTDPAALFGWAQSLGQFTVRQALIVGFAVLLLCFLYHEGDSLARQMTRMLRQAVGDQAQRYIEVATRAVRASVGSMLVVGLFDAVAIGLAYTLAGAPRALVWAAITGSLAAVPFLGYAAVAAMAMQSAVTGVAAPALLSLLLGCAVLILGDKVVRPMVARGGISLPFVWLLMGCIGGFSALGLAGLVIGPVALALTREMWEQRAREGSP